MKSWRRKKENKKARKYFLKNGSMFLEQLITDCNGITNPIRMFSFDQITKATNHFDHKCSFARNSPWCILYKGVIEGRSYMIKRFIKPVFGEEERAYNDIVLFARVSNHNGFLKLIGSCLEFPLPVLVFEDVEYRSLNLRFKYEPVLPWKVRLKIAKEVATAITYLHIAFPRIIIHRDIKAAHFYFDKNGTAKITDFSIAVTLPEGKSWIDVDTVIGTSGYPDPIYAMKGILSEYTDVYMFGILMLVLLLGREEYMDGIWILDYAKGMQERGEPVESGGDSNDMRPGQMKMFLDLALRCCCEERNEDRPKMIDVAKEIKLIEQAN